MALESLDSASSLPGALGIETPSQICPRHVSIAWTTAHSRLARGHTLLGGCNDRKRRPMRQGTGKTSPYQGLHIAYSVPCSSHGHDWDNVDPNAVE